jgi:hypothetical protein
MGSSNRRILEEGVLVVLGSRDDLLEAGGLW